LQPGGWTGPKSTIAPTSRKTPVLEPPELPELPTESSATPVDNVSPLDELPLVVADTLVMPNPVEKPGEAVSPQAARTKAARMGARVTLVG